MCLNCVGELLRGSRVCFSPTCLKKTHGVNQFQQKPKSLSRSDKVLDGIHRTRRTQWDISRL